MNTAPEADYPTFWKVLTAGVEEVMHLIYQDVKGKKKTLVYLLPDKSAIIIKFFGNKHFGYDHVPYPETACDKNPASYNRLLESKRVDLQNFFSNEELAIRAAEIQLQKSLKPLKCMRFIMTPGVNMPYPPSNRGGTA